MSLKSCLQSYQGYWQILLKIYKRWQLNAQLIFYGHSKYMRAALVLLVSVVTITSCLAFDPSIKIYQATLKGPFGEVRAFGNYDLNDRIWVEDTNQLKNVQDTLTKMMQHYGIQEGGSCSLEYYKDSSLLTEIYILYHQKGAQVIKYYAMRVLGGSLRENNIYLGSEETVGQRGGRNMSYLNYTKVGPSDSVIFVQFLIDKVNQNSQLDYSPENVMELKFWTFPLGRLILIQCKNTNKSSTYFTFLNATNSFSLVGWNNIPQIKVSKQLDYLSLNLHIKHILSSYFPSNLFRDQGAISSIMLFDVLVDPLCAGVIHFMLVLDLQSQKHLRSKYKRIMGMIGNQKLLGFGFKYLQTHRILILDQLAYSYQSQNQFHEKSYFQSEGKLIEGAVNQHQKQMVSISQRRGRNFGITKMFRISYPQARIYSTIYTDTNMFAIMNRYYLWDISKNYFNWNNICSQTFLYKQLFKPLPLISTDYPKALMRHQQYLQEYYLSTGIQSKTGNAFEYCSLKGSQYEMGFFYEIIKGVYFRHNFIRNMNRGDIYYLGKVNLNKIQQRLLRITPYRTYQLMSICRLIKVEPFKQKDIPNMYNLAKNMLLDRHNNKFQLQEIKGLLFINTFNIGSMPVWVFSAQKGGVQSQIAIHLEFQNNRGYYPLTYQDNDTEKQMGGQKVILVGPESLPDKNQDMADKDKQGNQGGAINLPAQQPEIITLSPLSLEGVKNDPYLISTFRSVQSQLPSELNSLNINSVQKGIFKNESICYQIYYGQNAWKDTHILKMILNPQSKEMISLQVIEVQGKAEQASFWSLLSNPSRKLFHTVSTLGEESVERQSTTKI